MNKHWFWALLLIIFFIPQILSLSLFKPLVIRMTGLSQLSIEKVHLTWLGPQRFTKVRFVTRDIDAEMDEFTSPLPLWSATKMKSVFGIQNGHFLFPSYHNASIEQVNGTLDGDQFRLTGLTKDGTHTGRLQVEGRYRGTSDFDLALDITELPVMAVDRLMEANGWLYKFLGASLNVKGTVASQGGVSLALQSTALQTTIQGTLTSKGLQLTQPLIAHWSPPLSLLAPSTVVTLTIAPDGFLLPLPFSLEQLAIGSATLDAGKILCRNQGSLKALLGLVKSGNTNQVEVWLTPLVFHVARASMSIERVDALIANSLHVCGWGSLDLAKAKYHLSLGLPEDTLRHVFGIQTLSSGYVLKIPLTGPFNNPTLATGPAAAKIAALLAAQEIPTKGVLGGMIHVVSKIKEEDSAPPAKRPFPWEK